MDNPSSWGTPDRLGLARVSWICLVFIVAYTLFQFGHAAIISAHPSPLNPTNANPWLLKYIHEQDGFELYVATGGLFAFLGATLLLPAAGRFRTFLASRSVAAVAIAAALVIVIRTRSTEFVGASPGTAVVVGLSSLAGLILVTRGSSNETNYRRVSIALGIGGAFLILLSGVGTSPEDYGYFLGPALKLLQGESITDVYMRYSLFGTGLFAGMMKLNFTIGQMELAIAIVTILWFWMYWLLGNMLIEDRRIRILFVSALFIVRFLWLVHHPAVTPQASPFRLDIWVPLAIVLWKYGFESWPAGLAFAAGFLLDASFGLFAFGAYLAGAGIVRIRDWRGGQRQPRKPAAIVLPLIGALAVQLLFLGGLIPQSAVQFESVQLGFLPIQPLSLFWPVLLAFPFAGAALLLEPCRKRKDFGAFLLILSALQLIYFFGRSHDNNLLNISGSWLLLCSFAWDTLFRGIGKRNTVVPILFCVLAAVAAAPRAREKVGAVVNHVRAGEAFPAGQLDKDINSYTHAWPRGDSTVVMFSADDAYWNYRLHLRQHGAYSPVFASMFLSETTGFLERAIRQGRTVVVNKTVPGNWVAALNEDSSMVNRGQAFKEIPVDPILRRLVLVPRPDDSADKVRSTR